MPSALPGDVAWLRVRVAELEAGTAALREAAAARDEVAAAQLAARDAQLAAALAQLAVLAARVEDLQSRLAKDSSTSSKPPSSDSPHAKKTRDRSLRGRSGRSPGKQPGAQSSTLRQSAGPGDTVICAPAACGCCGADLAGAEVIAVQKRQVSGASPPPPPVVIEYQVQARACGSCGEVTAGLAPASVTGRAQYGPGVHAKTALAVCAHYLPVTRAAALVAALTGVNVSAGVRGRAAARLGPFMDRVRVLLRDSVSIIAALHVATGQVITEPVTRNNPATFISFLHRLDQCTDPRLQIHLVMDNGSSHTSRATRAWIAAHPRITVTCTPKHASWLDMAELWFSVLTRALLRRGEFTSRASLIAKITDFTIRYNRTARPWKWAYDARTDHARYLARHGGQHPATPGPAAAPTLPQAA
jgi:transposase